MADKRRRKSLNLSIFRPKPDLSSIPPVPFTPVEKPTEDPFAESPITSDQPSPITRPRTLQKTNRTSVFGSLRSLHSLDDDEKAALARSDSKSSSFHEELDMTVKTRKGLLGKTVLHHGEVQTSGNNMFRKRNQYLILTESHLLRFKTHARAVEVFPSIFQSMDKTSSQTSPSGSSKELPLAAYQDISLGVPLEQIVAVYRLDDSRPLFTIEVSFLDERGRRASATHVTVVDPRECEVWAKAIRDAAKKARSLSKKCFEESTIKHVTRTLERDRDYNPEHFHMFKVAQRSTSKTTTKSSTEDLTRLNATLCYLAIGSHKVHLVPLPRGSNRSSSTSLSDLDTPTSFGITNLNMIHMQTEDDSLQLSFKSPLQQPYVIRLASVDAGAIALWLRYSSEYLRPLWLRQPFLFDVPVEIENGMDPPTFLQEDCQCFDRTLIAHCTGYAVDTSRVCYTVDYNCEDAPKFQLLLPIDGKPYSALELLAVFRSLRYNESFVTISFENINLGPLRFLYDMYGTDIDSTYTRSGLPTNLHGHQDLPVLSQEIRGLALKSRKLRRLDFSSSFPAFSHVSGDQHACGIPEALVPLCKKNWTNVDWIVLNGIRLADSDINFLVDAASERICHLRALEVGECGLSHHDVDVLLSTLSVQENTMEVINISGAQGRFSPELFQREIGVFSHIRRLNLTRVQKTAGPEPLIAPETLLTWRLEALHLSQTTLNEQTIDSIVSYLASAKSDILRELHLNQCGLTGKDLARFFVSMTRERGHARQMHVSANENRLEVGNTALFEAIRDGYGPSSLAMRMMDFEKELHFREMVEALASNTTLRSLDISHATLPYDASDETCEALEKMFATNSSLEELDISGELAHLDSAAFGIGLNSALHGLGVNKTLKLLRIEHQSLGLQGAYTLAGVLEANDTLVEIHCEHNDINLQSFTVLINALEKNKTLQYLPILDNDRGKSMEKVKKEFENATMVDESKSSIAGGIFKKPFASAFGGAGRGHRPSHQHNTSISSINSFTEQDVGAVMNALDDKWQTQISRLQKYLYRNYCLANGMPWDDEESQPPIEERPSTEGSINNMLEKVKLERTPVAKRATPIDLLDEKLAERGPVVFQLPED